MLSQGKILRQFSFNSQCALCLGLAVSEVSVRVYLLKVLLLSKYGAKYSNIDGAVLF